MMTSLRNFCSDQERAISYSQLQKTLGYQSKGAVQRIVPKLIEKHALKKGPDGKLRLSAHLRSRIKVLGHVQAGFPSPAEEELIDTLSLDEFLIKKPNATYIVKVSGDSMIEEGIKEGDLVLVERGREPKNGNIVIAQVDGQWTMKYYEKKNNRVILKAANKKYPPIIPKQELIIGGVVIANVRKY